MKTLLIAMALTLGAGMAYAAPSTNQGPIINGHSGGTDSAGCHTESATGVYHCH